MRSRQTITFSRYCLDTPRRLRRVEATRDQNVITLRSMPLARRARPVRKVACVDQFRRAGLVFDVRDSGPPGGQPVVLLHGFPQDQTCFDDVVPVLHEAGLRTLVPAQRGYCATARPAGRAAYRLQECVADVLALLDAAGLATAHVAGHDWGGLVAWCLGHRQASRLRSLVALSTPHPGAMAAAMPRSSQPLRSSYVAFLQLPWLPELLLPRILRPSLVRSGLPEAAADRYLRRLREPGALTAALNWYRALPWSLPTPTGPVSVPTTYAWGRADLAVSRTAAELTRHQIQGRYRFEALDAGHWLPETRPADIAALIIDAAKG
jgi:pimeloyl-ACP methyl ester carboxylesterase